MPSAKPPRSLTDATLIDMSIILHRERQSRDREGAVFSGPPLTYVRGSDARLRARLQLTPHRPIRFFHVPGKPRRVHQRRRLHALT